MGVLPEALNRRGKLRASNAVDGERIEKGRIYIAPPDFHMLIGGGRIRLSHGPRENMQRPCINVMFRSAAAAYGPRVAGVLLTGLLDDGAAGLWEIQQHGGATIVQDPEEAPYRSMPESAVRGFNVGHIVRLVEMPSLLMSLAMEDSNPSTQLPMPENLMAAGQTCPECGGVMTLARMDNLREYRCHTGHRYGLNSMLLQKSMAVENALNNALAQSEEMSALLEGSLSMALPENAPEICDEIAELRNEQETIRRLTSRRGEEPVAE
jgi:two-component system, chemotaxis family, protein-glutamate methylesterase/glutaminase